MKYLNSKSIFLHVAAAAGGLIANYAASVGADISRRPMLSLPPPPLLRPAASFWLGSFLTFI